MERADRRVPKPMSPTVRLTTAQAIVRYLGQQHTVADGEGRGSVPAMLGIFGHGHVAGRGPPRDRLLPTGGSLLRPDHPPGADPHGAARGDACPDKPV